MKTKTCLSLLGFVLVILGFTTAVLSQEEVITEGDFEAALMFLKSPFDH
jgi:uncharacterized membrane protein